MAILDLLSGPLVISLGITLLFFGLLGMYFSQKIGEQDHKISSMVGVVSSMAEEVHYLRSRLSHAQPPSNNGGTIDPSINLLTVSDDEVTDSDSDSDSDSVSDADESDEEDTNKPIEIMSELINISEVPSIKVINMLSDSLQIQYNENEHIENNNGDEADPDDESESESDDESSIQELEIDDSTLELMNLDSLKSIHIDNHHTMDGHVTIDYKKMSLPKLRELVIEKDSSIDTSKMKKQDLIKWLENK